MNSSIFFAERRGVFAERQALFRIAEWRPRAERYGALFVKQGGTACDEGSQALAGQQRAGEKCKVP